MPATEQYGAQPPIEILRLFIDRKGLYDRETLEWKKVEDTTLIASGAKPGGGGPPAGNPGGNPPNPGGAPPLPKPGAPGKPPGNPGGGPPIPAAGP